MKKIKIFSLLIILLIALIYTTNITAIPSKMILLEGEELKVDTLIGISVKPKESSDYVAKQASISLESSIQGIKKVDYELSLFDKINLKTIQASVIPKTTVVPVGATIGLKLYTDGVLVVGMSEIENSQLEKVKPYEGCKIKEGDRIIAVDDKAISCTADLVETVNEARGNKVEVKYVRENEVYCESMWPAKTVSNEYKLGLWVRDAAAGVGTLSFYEPSTKSFAALGHGIVDVDTGELVTIANGDITTANVLSIAKGEKGEPGEIRGSLVNQSTIGKVAKNTKFGIYGVLNNTSLLNVGRENELPVAMREEIKTGKAKIICSLENNKREEYEIEIQKIFANNNSDNKSMVIKITDSRLLEKTGGIIQGMSGSPIIQDGKFVGAVTHVLVNNPTMGYGVFADLMIKQMKEVK